MHMICHSMPISGSTELIEFFVYFVLPKNYRTPFWRPRLLAPEHMPPVPQPAASVRIQSPKVCINSNLAIPVVDWLKISYWAKFFLGSQLSCV